MLKGGWAKIIHIFYFMFLQIVFRIIEFALLILCSIINMTKGY